MPRLSLPPSLPLSFSVALRASFVINRAAPVLDEHRWKIGALRIEEGAREATGTRSAIRRPPSAIRHPLIPESLIAELPNVCVSREHIRVCISDRHAIDVSESEEERWSLPTEITGDVEEPTETAVARAKGEEEDSTLRAASNKCRADDVVRCQDGSRYICSVQRCDGVPDCEDGADEVGCPHSGIPSGPFRSSERAAYISPTRTLLLHLRKVETYGDRRFEDERVAYERNGAVRRETKTSFHGRNASQESSYDHESLEHGRSNLVSLSE